MRSRDWNETFVTDISDSDDSAIVIPSRRLDFDEQSVLIYYVSPWLCLCFVLFSYSQISPGNAKIPKMFQMCIH